MRRSKSAEARAAGLGAGGRSATSAARMASPLQMIGKSRKPSARFTKQTARIPKDGSGPICRRCRLSQAARGDHAGILAMVKAARSDSYR